MNLIIISEIILFQEVLGYFDLSIDSTEVSLSYNYSITITPAANSDIRDLKITGYSLDGGTTEIALNPTQTAVSNDVLSNVNSTSVRVYVTWNDDAATESMNDVNDTAVALSGGKAIVKVNINFNQIEEPENGIDSNAIVDPNSVPEP